MSLPSPDGGLTVDELARAAGLPVRTIREYQTMRILPPPAKRGRVGLYGTVHRERLALIARLQQRGYSLAGIRDLLASFESGANLPALLGLEIGPAALDETPLRLTRAELVARLPALADAAVRRHAVDVGLLHEDGARHYLVRSPSLLALVAGAMDSVDLRTLLDLVGRVRDQLDGLATMIVDELVAPMSGRLAGADADTNDGDDGDGTAALLQRGRVLLLQGIVSLLADRLGSALLQASERTPGGEQLRAAVKRVRVGAVLDADGRLQYRRNA